MSKLSSSVIFLGSPYLLFESGRASLGEIAEYLPLILYALEEITWDSDLFLPDHLEELAFKTAWPGTQKAYLSFEYSFSLLH